MPDQPVVLTIAGLDPSGGAGIVADIKTITSFGCYPVAALTSVTFQNTTGVFGAKHQTTTSLRRQVELIVSDLHVTSVKTGMLPTAEIVDEVVRLFSETTLPAPVMDPVMVSTSGHELIGDDAYQILKTKLLQLARVVTPNIPEAERLAGVKINNETDMRKAAELIKSLGASAVLIKGGHRQTLDNQALDLLLDAEGRFHEFKDDYIPVGNIHGSGCILSAAIASCLALGMNMEEAVREAKQYVNQKIRQLEGKGSIGHGAAPL